MKKKEKERENVHGKISHTHVMLSPNEKAFGLNSKKAMN